MLLQFMDFWSNHPKLLSVLLLIILLLIIIEWIFHRVNSVALSLNKAVLLINAKKPVILDIRELEYFKKGHLEGAQHFPNGQLLSQLECSTECPILLVLNYNVPPYNVLRMLRSRGFKQLFHIEGGMRAWQQANLPLSDTSV